MNKEWIPSPNYSIRTASITGIVIHWWDDPAKRPTIEGAIATLTNPARRASAHYIVSDRRVVQLVNESYAAWHAGIANPFTIGIEVDPRTPGATYDTVIELCRENCNRYSINPQSSIKGHNHYMATQCPGTLDLNRIRNGIQQGGSMISEEEHKRRWAESIVNMVMDIIEGDPHYKDHQPKAWQGHVNRLVNATRTHEERYFLRDILRYNKWVKNPKGSADPAVQDKAERFDQIKNALGIRG